MKRTTYLLLLTIAISVISCNTKTKETVVSTEYQSYIESHRTKYLQSFIKDERAPLDSADLPFVHFFEADEDYAVECKFKEADTKTPFDMATYSGITKPYRVYGYLECPVKGQNINLEIYQNIQFANIPAYADHLFLPFKDATNGEESYGGGRYIDLKASSIKDDKMAVDFNKTYNPWCAYSDGYNCPIPPIANHLDASLMAGEAKYTGPKKQRPQ